MTRGRSFPNLFRILIPSVAGIRMRKRVGKEMSFLASQPLAEANGNSNFLEQLAEATAILIFSYRKMIIGERTTPSLPPPVRAKAASTPPQAGGE
jgi:hypothetical protein